MNPSTLLNAQKGPQDASLGGAYRVTRRSVQNASQVPFRTAIGAPERRMRALLERLVERPRHPLSVVFAEMLGLDTQRGETR